MTSLLDYRADKLVDMVQPVNKLHPLNRGLVSWWIGLPGAQGSSRLMDVVSPGPNGNHGTLTNMHPETDWVSDDRGWNALDFSGGDDYIDVPSTKGIVFGRAARTVIVVFKQRTRPANQNSAFFHHEVASGDPWVVQIANDSLIFLFSSGNNNITLTGDEIPSLGSWHDLAFTFDGGSAWKYYLDDFYLESGGVTKSGTFGNTINTAAPTGINIGRRSGGAPLPHEIDGQIREVRYYDRLLSSNEVRWYFQLRRQGYPGLLNRIEPFFLSAEAIAAIRRQIIMFG